jgi:ATP-binding cassette, subfamily B, bacterial
VPQDVTVFAASARDNIAFGKPGATAAEIEAAARDALAEDFIRALPEGYDTLLGERGVTLSGGQKQRVSLARAFVSDRPAMLLDDTLSAVDPATERRILEGLATTRPGRTVVVATHRLSVVADADLVLVLDGGAVVEQGDHRTLLRRGGLYAHAWRLQCEASALERSPEDGA